MKKLEVLSCIAVMIPTAFGEIEVDFTVVDKLEDNKYALLAQHRIVIAKMNEDGTLYLSQPIDLMNKLLVMSVPYQTEYSNQTH